MDTNQRTANNYQINSFIKGMNSDTSYDMVGSDQYLFGQNIRITNNTLLTGNIDSNNTEYVAAPINSGINISHRNPVQNAYRILACKSIVDTGVIVIENTNHTWSVYKAQYNSDTMSEISISLIYTSYGTVKEGINKFPVVLLSETKNVLKAYIADGKGSPVCVFLTGGSKDISGIHEDYLRSGAYFPKKKARLQKTYGQLKTQQVQYTYRFYTRYGHVSKLAPLTNKIHVISSFRGAEEGNAEDTVTNVGFNVLIPKPEYDLFDSVQLYRISYIKYGEQPNINLIYDKKFDFDDDFKSDLFFNNEYFLQILDDGSGNLQTISLDEFSSLQQQTLIPTVIESSNGYLFYGNVEDKSIVNESQTSSIKVDYNLAKAYFYVNDNTNDLSPDYGDGVPKIINSVDIDTYHPQMNMIFNSSNSPITIGTYLKQCGLNYNSEDSSKSKLTYNDMFISSMMRSLKRDENYVYGIVFYDKFGNKSSVQEVHTINSDFDIDNGYLSGTQVIPLGISVTVTGFNGSDIVGFEVVRQPKDFNNTKNLLQVALSRPSRQGKYGSDSYRTPYYPSVFLTSEFTYNNWGDLNSASSVLWDKYFDHDATNVENFTLYQVFSPYINVRRTDCVQMLSGRDCDLVPLRYAQMSGYVQYDTVQNVRFSKQIKEMQDDENYQTGVLKVEEGLASNISTEDVYYAADGIYLINNLNFKRHDKPSTSNVITLDDFVVSSINRADSLKIKNVADVKNPNWENGFSNVQLNGTTVTQAVKQYKSYSTTVGSHKYNNWASNGMYNLAVSENEAATQPGNNGLSADTGNQKSWIYHPASYNPSHQNKGFRGWIGPGPVCLLLETSTPEYDNTFRMQHGFVYGSTPIGDLRYRIQNIIGVSEDVDPAADVTVYNISQGAYNALTTNYDVMYSDLKTYFTGESYDEVTSKLEIDSTIIVAISTQSSGRPEAFIKFTVATDTKLRNAHLGTLVCSIQHNPKPYSELDAYCGYGNYFELPTDGTKNSVTAYVFDGDVYLDYAEFTNVFKTYDFNDQKRTLDSSQVVYYIPMESEINTMFDYGFNYRNTQSSNLLLEPGEITGICSQSRPLHQYNMVYSDNNASISAYYIKPQIEQETIFQQRIAYSQLKTNGEAIDNWQIFKPADFIDADSKYGSITHLMSKNSSMYFWQNSAFGKLSVNERSLVTDNNGDTIQLGQGGVLNRVDYISSKYGMRNQDYCSTDTEDSVFWIDAKNRAVLQYSGDSVVNYCERLNVQNIVNKNLNYEVLPSIHYDTQSNELLCKLIDSNNYDQIGQLVFNTKLQIAQAVYTRDYDDIVAFGNVLVGLKITTNGSVNLTATQYNYLDHDKINQSYLSPTILKFAINSSPSQTKVFDNQKIVTLKKDRTPSETTNLMPYYLQSEHSQFIDEFLTNNAFEFETDLHSSDWTVSPDYITDREGNICYNIPRSVDTTVADGGQLYDNRYNYGGRLRGKWMTCKITNNNPQKDYCISHIITKFRQSYS